MLVNMQRAHIEPVVSFLEGVLCYCPQVMVIVLYVVTLVASVFLLAEFILKFEHVRTPSPCRTPNTKMWSQLRNAIIRSLPCSYLL